ncbi:MAG: hypothetical protein EBR09_05515 [Proteobacteria bacterium]|nr:hypothetical protein [Pseudomonadota bacterium]
MNFILRLTALLSFIMAHLPALTGCVPQGDVRTIQRPVPAASPSVSPNKPTLSAPVEAPQVAGGCKEGSEPAAVELRSCCKERNWGQACDGACWQEGVGAKLKKMCQGPTAPASDCAGGPDKSKKAEWCSFHYNRRYCGVTDADWLATCKNSASSGGAGSPTSSVSLPNDCDKSPAKSQVRDWCNFHYNRRYCGITDAEWVKSCTPAPAASTPATTPAASPAAASPANTATPAKTGTCKITQNRGFPFPRCPDRKTAKLCEEGTNGNEKGFYCVWSDN